MDKVNTKLPPTFACDRRLVPKTLKSIALRAIDNNNLIRKINNKLSLDTSASMSEHDTSRDSGDATCNVMGHRPCVAYTGSKFSIFHAMHHLENVVITLSDQVEKWLKFNSPKDRDIVANMSLRTSIARTDLPCIENAPFTDESPLTDEPADTAGLEDIVCAVSDNIVDVRSYDRQQQRVTFSKMFCVNGVENNVLGVDCNLVVTIASGDGNIVSQDDIDGVRYAVAHTCEETFRQIQTDRAQGKKRKRDAEDDELCQPPPKHVKPRCGCIIS